MSKTELTWICILYQLNLMKAIDQNKNLLWQDEE